MWWPVTYSLEWMVYQKSLLALRLGDKSIKQFRRWRGGLLSGLVQSEESGGEIDDFAVVLIAPALDAIDDDSGDIVGGEARGGGDG